MAKIVIIGAGFAGLAAAARLASARSRFEVSLVDRQENFNFLPMLPDTIGRGIAPEFLANRIEGLCSSLKCKFIRDEVISVDFAKKEVLARTSAIPYDFLIIASGSETNFYGNSAIQQYAYTLDSVQDASRIIAALEKNTFDAYLIGGAGYTGIEVATNLKAYLRRRSREKRVVIVERQPSILGLLPDWMKAYVKDNLNSLGIEVVCNAAIDTVKGGSITLSTKESFNNAMLIWTAGVRTSDFVRDLKTGKNPQGRLFADKYLKIDDSCFVAGDASWFKSGSGFLRMAVQFSIMEGRLAAGNILRLARGLPLKEYRPVDFGYIIPMANNRSCGEIFGIKMKGFIPTVLHFMMCIYRSFGWHNRLGIIKGLIRR